MKTLKELREAYNAACEALDKRIAEYDALAADASQEDVDAAGEAVREATVECDARDKAVKDAEAVERSRGQHQRVVIPDTPVLPALRVDEPDMYGRGRRSFLDDLYRSQIKGEPGAHERISRHQQFELEKRAITSSTFGGLIPPQYLLDLYAKASRNGRVFADQVNGKPLPDEGMSLIIPRLTTGTAAGIQATENTTVTTQDIVESDLTVPVRTIAGYVPVSRQGLERAAYNEEILTEDLIARYWQTLDFQCIDGSGSSGQILGLLGVSGIKTSAASSGDLIGCYPHIADVIQQIDTAVGGLGYRPTKIVMHPRRWGAFTATLDGDSRPILGINGLPLLNPAAVGEAAQYGFVGNLLGLPVYVDANIPTNLGGGTNEDVILIFADPVVHLWERDEDPVTLAFEQTSGTALTIQLIAYGYAAFTAGRYPGASGTVTGLTPPTFGS